MARSRMLGIVGVAALVLSACSSGGGAKSVTVQLATLNGSGISGTAVLTDLGNGKTKVDVATNVANGNTSMPAHIHKGTCDTLDPKPTYPFPNVENGKSTTEIDAKLAELQNGAFAVNLHTTADPKVYAACGNIPKA